MDLAALIAPVPVERFTAEHFGRAPLHIPAPEGSTRRALLSWDRLNALLAVRSHWSEANIKLIMNSRPVQPDLYIDRVETLEGPLRRADPAKVDLFLAMGASMVGNAIEDVSPEARAVAASLSDTFSGRAGANLYCSYRSVQAFASHCDLHEVFAVQCEGEKVWNIYADRAAAPVAHIAGDDAQAVIDRAKGPLLMQVRMRPGDTLYIPRGFYHDALASSDASLHLTFAVAPHTGRILFRLLEEMAMGEQAFREYLPDAREADGAALASRLDALAERMAEIVRSGGFRTALANRQRALVDPDHRLSLPQRPRLSFYARSDRPAEIAGGESPAVKAGGAAIPLGRNEEAARWLLSRPAFPVEELFARFPWLDREELRVLVAALAGAGLLYPYEPKV